MIRKMMLALAAMAIVMLALTAAAPAASAKMGMPNSSASLVASHASIFAQRGSRGLSTAGASGSTAWRRLARNRAMNWALRQRGCWYRYGRTGPCPDGYDCSGLVWKAYRSIGITLPRTTYGMLASSMLVRTYYPRRGDLAFYGSGHVELVTDLPHTTFGALEPGTRVGDHYWNPYWHPSGFYRVR